MVTFLHEYSRPDGSDNWVYASSTQGVINMPEYPSPALLTLAMLTIGLLILRRYISPWTARRSPRVP